METINSKNLFDYINGYLDNKEAKFKVFHNGNYVTDIFWDGENFNWESGTFTSGAFFDPLYNFYLIEEDKEIEKLNNIPINYADDRTPEEVYEYLRCTINNLANVINISNENLFELIDKVNNMENNK